MGDSFKITSFGGWKGLSNKETSLHFFTVTVLLWSTFSLYPTLAFCFIPQLLLEQICGFTQQQKCLLYLSFWITLYFAIISNVKNTCVCVFLKRLRVPFHSYILQCVLPRNKAILLHCHWQLSRSGTLIHDFYLFHSLCSNFIPCPALAPLIPRSNLQPRLLFMCWVPFISIRLEQFLVLCVSCPFWTAQSVIL